MSRAMVNVPDALRRLRAYVDLEEPGNPLRDLWDRLHGLPGGKQLFSRFVGWLAPYTGTIDFVVEELAPGSGRVVLRDERTVRNHLRSVHAIALANLAEVAANVALVYSLPDEARFIVAGFCIDYLKKARGDVTATSRFEPPTDAQRREVPVEVELRDGSGQVVARATFRSLVGPKKKARPAAAAAR